MLMLCISYVKFIPGLTSSSASFSNIGPGAYGSVESNIPLSFTNFNTERLTLDISSLKKQYMKLRERQKQAHVILSGTVLNFIFNIVYSIESEQNFKFLIRL